MHLSLKHIAPSTEALCTCQSSTLFPQFKRRAPATETLLFKLRRMAPAIKENLHLHADVSVLPLKCITNSTETRCTSNQGKFVCSHFALGALLIRSTDDYYIIMQLFTVSHKYSWSMHNLVLLYSLFLS